MKYSLSILVLFFLLACNQKQPQKPKALASHPPIDTFGNNKPKGETTTSIYTDDELMAEFAIVNDADGYSYVRDYPSKSATVTDTLQSGNIVFCMEPAGEWIGIDYYRNPELKDLLHGFIHKSRLVFVDKYPAIKGLIKLGDEVVLGDDKINITLAQEDFKEAEHRLKYNTEHNYLETIDGRHFWGTDGGSPKRQYKSIEINLNGKKVEIPEEGLQQLYEPNLNYTSATYNRENDILYIQSMNSDGAGGYLVLWRIEKGIYKDRFVFYGF